MKEENEIYEPFYDERNARIIDMRKQGATLQDIANVFDITRERVRQICAKGARRQRQTELERILGYKTAARLASRGYLSMDSFEGVTPEDIVDIQGLGAKKIIRLKEELDRKGIPNFLGCISPRTLNWGREQLIREILKLQTRVSILERRYKR